MVPVPPDRARVLVLKRVPLVSIRLPVPPTESVMLVGALRLPMLRSPDVVPRLRFPEVLAVTVPAIDRWLTAISPLVLVTAKLEAVSAPLPLMVSP